MHSTSGARLGRALDPGGGGVLAGPGSHLQTRWAGVPVQLWPWQSPEWELGWGQAGPGAECQRWLLPEIGSCRAGEPGERRRPAGRGQSHSRAHGGHGRLPALQPNSIFPTALPYLSRDLPAPRSTKERERDGVRPEGERLGSPPAPAPPRLTCTPAPPRLTCTRRRFRPSWAGPPSPPGCPPCPSLQTQTAPSCFSRPSLSLDNGPRPRRGHT